MYEHLLDAVARIDAARVGRVLASRQRGWNVDHGDIGGLDIGRVDGGSEVDIVFNRADEVPAEVFERVEIADVVGEA